jgi:hypothetical protein
VRTAAEAVDRLTDADLVRVGEISGQLALTGTYFAKAAALAALEVIEGTARPLARTRRRPGSVKRG